MSIFINTAPTIPPDYIKPSFPSLYEPFSLNGGQSNFLYKPQDIWQFTLFWTLVFYAAMHATACGFAVLMMLFGRAEGTSERQRGGSVSKLDEKEKENGVEGGDARLAGKRQQRMGALGGRQLRALIKRWRARRKFEWAILWIVPAGFIVTAGVEGFIAGSCVGGLLAAVYNSGDFRMSTWVPFIWGLINSLVLILSSFAIEGAL